MRFTQSWLAVGAVVVSMTLPTGSWAKSSLDERLDRLENIVDNQVNVDLLNQLDAMQQEVQELRGKIEEQQNALQLLNQKQDKLFVNLDSRIGSLDKTKPAENQPVANVTNIEQQIEQTEKQDYDAAYRLMSSKKYPDAIAAFNALLAKYPNGIYAPNANYWLGEIYVAEWHLNRADTGLLQLAVAAFQTVITNHAEHHKAADALLKLGLVEIDQEHWVAAKDLLTQVVAKYPGSSRARLAEAKLQSMQQDGHI